jgi:hypothetical protein
MVGRLMGNSSTKMMGNLEDRRNKRLARVALGPSDQEFGEQGHRPAG